MRNRPDEDPMDHHQKASPLALSVMGSAGLIVGLSAASLFVLLALSCGGSPVIDGCERSDRSGTYLLEFDKISGSCPEIDDILDRIDGSADLPGGCEDADPPRWSDANCTFERTVACYDASTGDYGEFVTISEQVTSDGDLLEGTYGKALWDISGSLICRGTYDITAERM